MKALRLSIYEEHFEELAFLHTQGKRILHDPNSSLRALARVEERHEAHLDGLVLGDALALEFCEAHAGDAPDAQYAALCVYLRHARLDLVEANLATLPAAAVEEIDACASALARELPDNSTRHVGEWVARATDGALVAIARAAAERRLDIGGALLDCIGRASPDTMPTVLRALGESDARSTSMVLYTHMQLAGYHGPREAALAALKLRDAHIGKFLERRAGPESWAATAHAVVATPNAWRTLERHVTRGSEGAADCVLAIGLLGHPDAVDALLDWLSTPALASRAAEALFILSGVVVLDDDPQDHDHALEADDLTFEEPLPWCFDAKSWRTQLEPVRERIRSLAWVRAGAAYSPMTTVQLLRTTSLSPRARQLLRDELTIREDAALRDYGTANFPVAARSYERVSASLQKRLDANSRRPSPTA